MGLNINKLTKVITLSSTVPGALVKLIGTLVFTRLIGDVLTVSGFAVA